MSAWAHSHWAVVTFQAKSRSRRVASSIGAVR